MEDIPVIVVDVRKRPDEGVQHEDQPRQDDHERDDEPQVHREPPFQQLAIRSPFGRVASSGDFIVRAAEEPQGSSSERMLWLVRVRYGDTFRAAGDGHLRVALSE